MKQYWNGGEELQIGWVPIAEAALTANSTPVLIPGMTGTIAAKYRRFVLVIYHEGGATGLFSIDVCKSTADGLATASEVKPCFDGQAKIVGPFDNIGVPYYIKAIGAVTGVEVSILASENGEPEELIAGV